MAGQTFSMFIPVPVVASPRKDQVGIDPLAQYAQKTLLRFPTAGQEGTVQPNQSNAAFRLTRPQNQPPVVSEALKLRSFGAESPVPLDVVNLRIDNQWVAVDIGLITGEGEWNALKAPRTHDPLELSISASLNSIILSSVDSSLDSRVARGVLIAALTRLRFENQNNKFGTARTEAECRDDVKKLDIRTVMEQLTNATNGLSYVKNFSEMFIKNSATSDSSKTMKTMLQRIFRESSQSNPILAEWFESLSPKEDGPNYQHKVITTVFGRPSALSFTAVQALIRTPKSGMDVMRAIRAIEEFSTAQARQAGQNPAELQAMKQVLEMLSTIGRTKFFKDAKDDKGAKDGKPKEGKGGTDASVAKNSSMISTRALAQIASNTSLCKDLVAKVAKSVKLAEAAKDEGASGAAPAS